MHRWIKTAVLAAALASLGTLVPAGCSGGSNTPTTSRPTHDPATIAKERALADDRAAQSSLRNALTAAKTAYTDADNFATSTSADLASIEPSLTYVSAGIPSAGPENLSVAISDVVVHDGQVFAAAAWSNSGTCFWIKEIAVGAGAGILYGTGTACTGAAALAAAAPGW